MRLSAERLRRVQELWVVLIGRENKLEERKKTRVVRKARPSRLL